MFAQCAVRHTSFASAFITRRSQHHLPKANIIQKTHLCLGRQKCVFCWRRRRDLKQSPLVEIVASDVYAWRTSDASFLLPSRPRFISHRERSGSMPLPKYRRLKSSNPSRKTKRTPCGVLQTTDKAYIISKIGFVDDLRWKL